MHIIITTKYYLAENTFVKMIHFILINVLKIVIVEQAIYNQLLITQIHKPYKNHIKTFQFGFQDSFQVKNGPVESLSESYE